jgi:hypothetical protein
VDPLYFYFLKYKISPAVEDQFDDSLGLQGPGQNIISIANIQRKAISMPLK